MPFPPILAQAVAGHLKETLLAALPAYFNKEYDSSAGVTTEASRTAIQSATASRLPRIRPSGHKPCVPTSTDPHP